MVGLGFRGEVQIQDLTVTQTSPSPRAGDEGQPLLKALAPRFSRNRGQFGGCCVASTEKVPRTIWLFLLSAKFTKLYLYLLLKPCFCLTESRISGKALWRLGGMLCHGNSRQRGYTCSFSFPPVRRVLPRRANRVLPRRYPSLVR